MKCNEFMHAAESFTPSQLMLMRTGDEAIAAHASECASCGRWLESQTLLGSAMQALSASTAGLEAGPGVEQAVLRAFREAEFTAPQSVEPERAAPAAWQLSRIFEYGAYAAVAAALIMAVFLGSRLLHDRQAQQQKQAGNKIAAPAVRSTSAGNNVGRQVESSSTVTSAAKVKTIGARTQVLTRGSARTDATASDTDDYVALMLCDPLICAGDEEVVRVELPAAAPADGSSSQPALADVVIGEDGLVRAMRIVR